MDFSDVNRRSFLKTSAAATAAGTSLAAAHSVNAAQSLAEAEAWKARVGNRFNVGDAQLELKSVDVKSHSDRPHNVRPHSVSMMFVVTHGTPDPEKQHYLENGGLMISRVVSPEGDARQYFEGILS